MTVASIHATVSFNGFALVRDIYNFVSSADDDEKWKHVTVIAIAIELVLFSILCDDWPRRIRTRVNEQGK